MGDDVAVRHHLVAEEMGDVHVLVEFGETVVGGVVMKRIRFALGSASFVHSAWTVSMKVWIALSVLPTAAKVSSAGDREGGPRGKYR